MATFLDVSGLAYFSKFFVFIFVWLIVYALIQYTKVLGDAKMNQGISVILGLIIALFVLFSDMATGLIEYISPWFAILLVFIVLASVAMKSMGASAADIGSPQIKTVAWVVILVILIVGSLSYVRDNTSVPGDNETSVDYSKSTSIIFHPSVLGAIFILAIAVFTIALLTKK